MYLIKAQNVSLRIEGTDILHGISLLLFPGELVGLLGPSGCGKSSLVRVLLKMTEPSKGEVYYGQKEQKEQTSDIQKSFGYVPQDDIVHRSLTVEKAFHYSFLLRKGPGIERDTARQKVNTLMKKLDLSHRAKTRIKRLSGGERKRVNLGIELLTDPIVLFLDEPTSGLDPHLDLQMMKLFKELTTSNRSLLVTTHILTNIDFFDTVFFLYQGYLVFGGSPTAALKFFDVPEHEYIYTKVRRVSPMKMRKIFLESPYYKEFLNRKPTISPDQLLRDVQLTDKQPIYRSPEKETDQIKSTIQSSEESEKPELEKPVVDAIDDELLKLKERLQQSKNQDQNREK